MTHRLTIRVYYEDTDFGGIVYYANYLKFIERGRSEWVRELGVDQIAMKEEGVVFAVRAIEAEYLRPGKYDDLLEVVTEMDTITGARMIVRQSVLRDGEPLFTARVTVVAVHENGTPARLPAALRGRLN
ncbi:MAG: tol-pal system-associated acyl-CoA thioesterase [Rhodobacterales bacterium]|nr:MAG: tol-pal system-associated acyl-CoA thioesterase [Rhodobacterales bacterium]